MIATAPSEHETIEQAPPRTRWRLPRVRISVRALMGLVLVLAIGLGWYVRGVHIQQDAVAAIRHAGGSASYDRQWGSDNPDTADPDGRWQAPRWLARNVPVDYVANVDLVDLMRRGTKGPSDETLASVARLDRLRSLFLIGSSITDAGLAHLKGLNNLRDLRIDHTPVTDAGLEHLKGLTQLRALWISDGHITDEGVLGLERALPRLRIYRLGEWPTSGTLWLAMPDVRFARSQPVRLACSLLSCRAQSMVFGGDHPEFIATIEALCDLEADDKLSLSILAETCASGLGLLHPAKSPGLDATQRQILQRRCTDRAIEALSRAIDLGYDNIRRLDGDPEEMRTFVNLREHPAFRRLVDAMRARHPAP